MSYRRSVIIGRADSQCRVEVPLDQLTGHALFAELVDANNNAKIEYLPVR